MCHGPRQCRHRWRNLRCSHSEPPESVAQLLRLCEQRCPPSTAETASSTGQSGGAASQTGPSTGQPAGAVAAQHSLDPCLLLALCNLFQCPGNNEEAGCAQQNAPELIPELAWEAVQGQGLAGKQEAAGHKEMGKDDNDECDGYERGVASGAQAVRPSVQLEAHDLPLQNKVCNRPCKSDHWILQQQTKNTFDA